MNLWNTIKAAASTVCKRVKAIGADIAKTYRHTSFDDKSLCAATGLMPGGFTYALSVILASETGSSTIAACMVPAATAIGLGAAYGLARKLAHANLGNKNEKSFNNLLLRIGSPTSPYRVSRDHNSNIVLHNRPAPK